MLPVLAGLTYLALLPQARADVFMYDFTETAVDSVHVTFNLPTFLQNTGDVTTFNVITGHPLANR